MTLLRRIIGSRRFEGTCRLRLQGFGVHGLSYFNSETVQKKKACTPPSYKILCKVRVNVNRDAVIVSKAIIRGAVVTCIVCCKDRPLCCRKIAS